MNIAEVKELLTIVNDSKLTEFDLQMDNVVLHMSKNTHQAPKETAAPQAPTQQATAVSTVPQTATEVQVEEVVKTTVSEEGNLIKAPIVGVVYLAASPDKPNYKKVGDTVEVGETLCIVEAMKLMNEITSDVAGTVTEVLIENEEVVEYNQPLFRIV